MKLSTKTRYGTRILVELASNNSSDSLNVKTISSRQKIPFKYLEQIFRILKQSDMVKSLRGPKGGYQLAKAPETISLGEVVRLFEGQTDLVACINTPENCEMAAECIVRSAWQEATSALYQKLDSITIADLVQQGDHPSLGCCTPQE